MAERRARGAAAGPGHIRPAAPPDAPLIAAIYNESIAAADATMDRTPKTAADVEGWLAGFAANEGILVLEGGDAGGEIAGWGIVKRYSEREGYRFAAETSVYLRRALVGQRRGYGSRLQAALLDRCRAWGYHHLVAKIWADNEISLALHHKFGYETVGVQREIGYVAGRWRDVAILQKLLD